MKRIKTLRMDVRKKIFPPENVNQFAALFVVISSPKFSFTTTVRPHGTDRCTFMTRFQTTVWVTVLSASFLNDITDVFFFITNFQFSLPIGLSSSVNTIRRVQFFFWNINNKKNFFLFKIFKITYVSTVSDPYRLTLTFWVGTLHKMMDTLHENDVSHGCKKIRVTIFPYANRRE